MRGVNLIPQRHRTARQRRIRTHRWLVGTVTYTLLLLVGWGATRLMTGGAHRAVAEQLTEADARIADADSALKTIQPRLAAALATLEAGNSVGDQPDWAILLEATANLLGDDVVLTRFYLEPIKTDPRQTKIARQYVLHIQGIGRAHETVSQYVLRLENLGLFDSVKLLSTQREPLFNGTAVGFEVDCAMGGATP